MSRIEKITLVGGGPSAVACYVAIKNNPPPFLRRIKLISETDCLKSFAFHSDQHDLITNTSAGVTSIDANRISDLLDWLASQKCVNDCSAESFVPRSTVGEYIRDRLSAAASHLLQQGCETEFVEGKAIHVEAATPSGVSVIDSAGCRHVSDALVIATGAPYSNPWPGLAGTGVRYVANPFVRDQMDMFQGQSIRVLIAGSNLSAIDAALRILRASPDAVVTMVSKTGYLPSVRRHLMLGDDDAQNCAYRSRRLAFASSKNLLHEMKKAAFHDFRAAGAVPEIRMHLLASDAIQQLHLDAIKCETGKSGWQNLIASMIDTTNLLWCRLQTTERRRILCEYGGFIERYVSAIPLTTAKELLFFSRNDRLQIRRDPDGLQFTVGSDRQVIGGGVVAGRSFDVLVNGTGLDRLAATAQPLFGSMDGCLFKRNEFQGIKVDPSNLRATTKSGDLPIYVMGAPVYGSLLITNYIRSSVIQGERIAKDIVRHG